MVVPSRISQQIVIAAFKLGIAKSDGQRLALLLNYHPSPSQAILKRTSRFALLCVLCGSELYWLHVDLS